MHSSNQCSSAWVMRLYISRKKDVSFVRWSTDPCVFIRYPLYLTHKGSKFGTVYSAKGVTSITIGQTRQTLNNSTGQKDDPGFSSGIMSHGPRTIHVRSWALLQFTPKSGVKSPALLSAMLSVSSSLRASQRLKLFYTFIHHFVMITNA